MATMMRWLGGALSSSESIRSCKIAIVQLRFPDISIIDLTKLVMGGALKVCVEVSASGEVEAGFRAGSCSISFMRLITRTGTRPR